MSKSKSSTKLLSMGLMYLSVSSDGAMATIAIGSLLIMSSKHVASASMNLK